MIGNNSVRRLVGTCGRRFCQFAALGDQRLEGVGIVVIVNALHDSRDTFETHSGVDRRTRQVTTVLRRNLLILHEHKVPDFDKAVAILVRGSRRSTGDMVAVIVKDFRTWPARPSVAHRPKIILGRDADDAVVRQTRNALPKRISVVVSVIDSDDKAAWVESPFAGDEIPGK